MSAPIRLDFAASTAKARAEINALSATIEKLQTKLLTTSGMNLMGRPGQGQIIGKTAQDITKTALALEGLGGRTVDLAAPVKQTEQLVENINKGKISLDEYRRASGQASRVVTQQLALQRATISNFSMGQNGKMTGDFKYGNVTEGIKPLERLAMQARVTGMALQGLGQHYIDMGKNMAFSARQLSISLTGPFLVVSALSMKAYMDTAASLTEIAKLYGDTGDGFERSSNQIKAEARDLARSMSDTYAAAYSETYEHQRFYASQGLTGADLSGSTQQAIRLQMLGDVDTEDAQRAITTLTNVYGVQIDQMGLYVDYMNKIEDSTTLTMQDFSEALPKIGPIIKSFEDDPKEATKAMAEMLEAGKRGGIQSATEIANAWKSIYTKVARPTEQLKDTWNELGSKNGVADSFMGIVTKNGGDVMEIVKEISTLTQDWNDVDKGRLFSQIAGAQQVARMSTFAQQLANSSDTIKNINEEFDKNPQALRDNSREQEDQIMDSPEKRWAQFLNRLRDTGVTIGEQVFGPIMTILEKGAGFVEAIVSGFGKLPGPLKVAASILGGFAVTLGPLIGVLGALIQVTGVLQGLYGTGKGAIGNIMTKAITGRGNKALLTPEDRIREVTEDENFQYKTATAYREMMMQMQATTDGVSGSLSAFETQIKKTTQSLMNDNTSQRGVASGRGNLRPQDVERRSRILRAGALGSTGERMPQREQVYVPPKPPKGRRSHEHLEMQQYKQAVERSQEAKRVHDLEMETFRKRQADARRVAARYESFTDYLKNTPQEKLDSNYEASRVSPERAAQIQQRHTNARMLDRDGMRRIASQANAGHMLPKAPSPRTAMTPFTQMSALDGQVVRDQVGYVSRDIAATKNRQEATKSAQRRAQQEKEINRLKQEQVRLNQVLKGSTQEIAQESERIRQATGPQTAGKTGLIKPRGMMDSMRFNEDQILDEVVEAPDGRQIAGRRTGRTKSGTVQASDRHSRRVMRRMSSSDREHLESLRDPANPYVEAQLSSGTVNMTPEHWQMADTQIQKATKSQEKLAKTQKRINENAASYVSNISNAVTGAGALVMMFSNNNEMAQWFGGLTTAFGISMSMMPKTAEKVFKTVANQGAEIFSKIGGFIGSFGADEAGGFAANLVGSVQSKFLGLSGWFKANAGAIMGWGAVIAAAIGLGVLAYNRLQKSAEEHREQLRKNVDEAKSLSEALEYHYIEPMQAQNQGEAITDLDRQTADALLETEEFADRINQIRGLTTDTQQDIDQLRLALNPAAIKILGTGGTEAEVNKMVRSSLVAAGASEATIEDFKLRLDVTDVEALVPQSTIDGIQSDILNERTRLEQSGTKLGQQLKGATIGGGVFTSEGRTALKSVANDAIPFVDVFSGYSELDDMSRYTSSIDEQAEKLTMQIKETISAASEEVKPEVGEALMTMFEIPPGASQETVNRITELRRAVTDNLSEINVEFNADWGKEALAASDTALNTMLAGQGNAFKSGEEASEGYHQALKELKDAGIELSDSQQLTINNLFRTGAGMDKLGEHAAGSEKQLNDFSQEIEDIPAPPKTLKQLMADMNASGQASERGEKRLDSFTAALNRVPAAFSRRWEFYVDFNSPDEVAEKITEVMREGAGKANDWGLEYAAKQMEQQHQSAVDGIRAAGDRSLKALEAQQKAAEKAMKDREKALGDKHKAQTKALDNQHKDEQKIFDKQQKEEKKRFDKQQKEEKKLFDKDIERQKKDFEESWKQREDTVATYYEASRSYLEDQQDAEDKLDKARDRQAEAQRKRQEMLNDLANKNVDINVAIAAGDLDEAARISNEAAQRTQDYYAGAGQDISDAESEDRKDARGRRIDALSGQEESSREFISKTRDQSQEGFNDDIEGQQEAFGDRQEGKGEAFQDRLDREKEEFQERLEARKEQLQLQQEQEKEFLAAQREAEAEYFANKRAEIQAVTDASIKGAEDAFAARKEAMELELEFLKLGTAQSEQEIRETSDRILGVYQKYGVDLGEAGKGLQDGMIEHYHAGVDQATEKIRQDEKWQQVGSDIGTLIAVGLAAGLDLTPGDIMQMALHGELSPELDKAYKAANFQSISQGNRPINQRSVPRRAAGGPIFGPGTGTSDSIPAMLSNGEHVLTAAEVRALGGHNAVERFRQQAMAGKIAAFAKGGRVGASTGSIGDQGLTVTVAPTGLGGMGDGGVLGAVASDVQTIGTQFDESLASTAAPAWKLFGNSLIEVKNNSIDPTFDAMQVAMQRAQEETINTTAGVMSPAWFQFGQNLEMVRSQIWDYTMESMQAGLTSLANSTSDAIVNNIIPDWSDGANHIQDMQNNVIDPMMQATRAATTETAENFGTAADMIGVGWGRVKDNAADPVRYTIGTVFNDGLVGMWNNVADALDLDKMNKHEFSFASGGVLPGYTPGTDVHHFSSPTGGKLHLSGGEAIMRPEWTRAVGGPSAVEQMNSAAKRGNLSFHDGGIMPDFEPDDGHLRKYQTHQDHFNDGGVFRVNQAGGNRIEQTPLSTPYNKRLWDIVRTIAPGSSLTSTEVWRPSGAQRGPHHGTGHAIDVSDGGAQTPTAMTMGISRFFNENYGPALTELIHWPLNGWQNIKNGSPLMYDSTTNSDHMNHVHLAAHTVLPDPGGDIPLFAGFGAGALGGMDPAVMAAVNKFNEDKDALKKQIEAHIKAGPDTIMKAIPGKIFTGMTDGMQAKIMEAMPMAGMASLGAYGLNHEDHIREIIAAAKERGLPKSAAKIALATALVESELRMYANHAVPESFQYPHEAIGSDHTSIGLFQQQDNGAWGTVAQRMNPRASAGLFYNALMRVPGWQTMDPGAAAQKVQASAHPDRYGYRMAEAEMLMKKVGGWDSVSAEGASSEPEKASQIKKGDGKKSNASNWFDSGGVATGKGFMTKNIIRPERVLSPGQTESFDSLVSILDRSFNRRSHVAKDTVSSPLSDADFTRKVTDLDTSLYSGKSREREVAPKTQESIAKSLQPIFNAFQTFIQREVVPGVVEYATDLIQMKTDEERLEKVSGDIIGGIEGIHIPSNNEVNMVFGGTVYGDGHLVQIMEDYKRQILTEVRAISDEAARRVAGK